MTGGVTLPPYARVLDATLEDDAVLAMPFAPEVVGRPGFLHGGAIAGLLDLAATVAVRAALAGDGGGTARLVTSTVDFRRGGRDALTRAVGHVTRLGTRIATVDAIAWQGDRDQPIAAARLTFELTRR